MQILLQTGGEVIPVILLQSDMTGSAYSFLFLFHPLLPLMSPNSSSCIIPTTKAVTIQPTLDGATESAIVLTGFTPVLSIDWKTERGE